jgi:hypothetical protein
MKVHAVAVEYRLGGMPLIMSLLFAGVAAAPGMADSTQRAAAPEPPAPTAEASVLELPGDGFLQGKLLPTGEADGGARTTFRWQSPLFDQPIEFRLDGIRRVRLVKQPSPPPAADAWRADLQGGDIAIGELDAIDADHVVLRVPGVGGGPLRIRRDAVLRLARPTEPVKLPKAADIGGPNAVVEAFDRARGSFTVRTDGIAREIPVAEVSAIEFPDSSPGDLPPAELACVLFHGGSRLTAKIIEVTPSGLRLNCLALDGPLECGLAQLAVLEPRGTSAIEAPGRQGLLEAASGRMLGSLVGMPGAKAGVGWQPRGAVAPVAIDSAKAMKVTYRGLAGVGKEKEGKKAAAKSGSGPAAIFLKNGDSIQCTVLYAGPEGARIRTEIEADILVPAAAIRAIELLPSAAAPIPKDTFTQLLVLPRLQQADSPTHMLRLMSGDYLRGKLVSLDEKTVRFDVLRTVKELPRTQVARLIWLSVVGDGSQERAAEALGKAVEAGSLPVRATTTDGRWISFAATRLDGDLLVGRNGVLGTTAVDLARCDHLDLGRAVAEDPRGAVPYSQWQLKPAAVPRALINP